MIICICHRVSDRDIAREAAAGSSFDDLQFDLGVGTRCGSCLDCARDTHRRHAAGGAHGGGHCPGAGQGALVAAAA